MDEIVEALKAEQEALAAMVEPLDGDALSRPSRCEGWSVADVLLHLAQTNELAVASAEQRFEQAARQAPDSGPVTSVDEWADAVVAAARTDDLDAVRDRWRRSADAQVAALARCNPKDRVQWVAGDMAARTLATTRLSETWIHSGDIAWGLGVELPASDRLWNIARLAHRTLPYAFASAGRTLQAPVRFELRSPSSDTWVIGDDDAGTVIRGDALELCGVAGQRLSAADTELTGEGPDADAVLELVRTFA